MSAHIRHFFVLATALLTLAALSACGGSTAEPACGDGTEADGDRCVAAEQGPSCGDGTELRDGECVIAAPGPECGDETMLVDGTCVPADDAGTECGAGTMLSDGECLPESDVECADGTTLDGESCVPDDTACGDGVEFDSMTRECVSGMQITCGENTVEEDGTCVVSEASLKRPDGARQVIADADLQRMEDIGMTIYGGLNPPDISGRYFSENSYVVYDQTQGGWLDDPTDHAVCDSYWTYESLDAELKYATSRELTTCGGGYSGQETYVSGAGRCFTTYSSASGEFEGCQRDVVNVRSGCLTDEGIANTSRANFGNNYQGESCQDLISAGRMGAEGEIRLRQEGIMVRQDDQ